MSEAVGVENLKNASKPELAALGARPLGWAGISPSVFVLVLHLFLHSSQLGHPLCVFSDNTMHV
jgi:hypothetical protein